MLRARRLSLMSALVLPVVGAACVGDSPRESDVDDDVDVDASLTDAGAGSSSSSGGGSADAEADAGRRTLGAFLTSQKLPGNFAATLVADATPFDARAAWQFIDGICQAAATGAELPNPADYRAVLLIASADAETNRVVELREFPRASDHWCAVSLSKRQPSCEELSGEIFENSEAILLGPLHNLITDEYGRGLTNSRFLSGVYFPPNSSDPEQSNCSNWSDATPAADGGEPPSQGGIGVASARVGTPSQLTWLGQDREPCGELSRPLLCLEVPAPDPN